MKTLKKIFVLVAFSGLLLQSCTRDGMWGIKGEGAQITEEKTVIGFDAIDLEMDADVVYTQDTIYKVEITAQENILAVMDIKVEGSELKLQYKRNVWKHDGITIIVHSPEIRKMEVSGSGEIVAKQAIQGTDLELEVSGSGKVDIASLNMQKVDVDISGSGDVYLRGGSCTTQDIEISGSGNISADMLSAVNSSIDISGSGESSVNVSGTLNVEISGNGKVKYKGNPVITKHISGSGDLIKI